MTCDGLIRRRKTAKYKQSRGARVPTGSFSSDAGAVAAAVLSRRVVESSTGAAGSWMQICASVPGAAGVQRSRAPRWLLTARRLQCFRDTTAPPGDGASGSGCSHTPSWCYHGPFSPKAAFYRRAVGNTRAASTKRQRHSTAPLNTSRWRPSTARMRISSGSARFIRIVGSSRRVKKKKEWQHELRGRVDEFRPWLSLAAGSMGW